MLKGYRTWMFNKPPTIISTGTVGGPFEANGNIPKAFDRLHGDMWIKQSTFEKAQQILMEEASDIALTKGNIQKDSVNFFISGDLINQITPSNFAANTLDLPYLGLFSACATSMESLALSSMIIDAGGADYILSGTASHNAATEKQFRYPTEYGGQKPPTAHWTVTGAGCALVTKNGTGPKVTSATIGKVVDMSMTNPYNMGEVMAPAAVDTIETHLKERQVEPNFYDLIITGDLGHIGREISLDLMQEKNMNITGDMYKDCGLTIYREDQPVLSGASGTGSSAVGVYGHFLQQIKEEKLNRILVVATGSLHSPLSVNQNNSIPGIAHAVSIEAGRDNS